MTCYIVTFEINSEEIMSAFRAKLMTYTSYCPVHRFCWAILTDQKAKEVHDYLRPVLTDNDRLFIIRSGTEAAWNNAYALSNSEWLKKNL